MEGMDSQGTWLELVLAAVALAACNDPAPYIDPPDAGAEPITLHGRIVDFESCASWNRCEPVEGVLARLYRSTGYVSEPSGRPGRFALPSPPAHEDDILVDPGPLAASFAPTLNPWAAPAALSDVYEIELYVLPAGRNPDGSATLLTALAELSPPIDLVGNGVTPGEGGYIGQVLREGEDGLDTVMGARVEVVLPGDWPEDVPAPQVRFVNAVPRYTSGDVLYDESYGATGPFGIFVIPTRGQTAMITVRVSTSDTVFREVNAPVAPGMVTLGLHTP